MLYSGSHLPGSAVLHSGPVAQHCSISNKYELLPACRSIRKNNSLVNQVHNVTLDTTLVASGMKTPGINRLTKANTRDKGDKSRQTPGIKGTNQQTYTAIK